MKFNNNWVRCPRCDNPIEDDLQDGETLLCIGGVAPCGHEWNRCD